MKRLKSFILEHILGIYGITLIGLGLTSWCLGVLRYFVEVFIALCLASCVFMVITFIRDEHEIHNRRR